jgi:predicted ATP-grasp superfamily ATP-dependent carboligase
LKVLVLNGETRPALAITRSLGRLGHEVTVAAHRQPSLASVSRHCTDRELYPDPRDAPDDFADAIMDIVSRRGTNLLLPITEIATTLVTAHRHRLPPDCVLPVPSSDALAVANDKGRVLELAARLGVPAPRTVSLAAGAALPPNLPFPCVIKPTRSRVRLENRWILGGVDYANNAAELERKLAALPSALFPLQLQERLGGEGIGVFACYWAGQPVAMFSHRRLREKPPSGGVSVLCESVPLDALAAGHASNLLSALAWHGVAMVEFKRDGRDGAIKLIEINGRFWGSLQLAIDAGVDFPAIVAKLASGERVSPVREYRAGIRSRWFLGDLDALNALMTRPIEELRLQPDHPGRWRSLIRFLNFWYPGQRSEVLRVADLSPGLLEIRRWLSGS